jgi:hypothetical protein
MDIINKFIDQIGFSYPQEVLYYVSLCPTSEIVKTMRKFIIDTKNYELLLEEPHHLSFKEQSRFLSQYFDPEMIRQIAMDVAEHLEKSHDSLEISLKIYDKFERYDRVLEIWLKQQINNLQNINPISLLKENARPNAEFQRVVLSTVESRYPGLYQKYSDLGVFDAKNKTAFSLWKIEQFMEFYRYVLQNQYEESYKVLRARKIIPLEGDNEASKFVGEFSGYTSEVKQAFLSVIFPLLIN